MLSLCLVGLVSCVVLCCSLWLGGGGGAAAGSIVAPVGVCACLCENVHMFECVCAQSVCVVYACVSVCGNCDVCESFILLGH